MDYTKIGNFIYELRREKKLTQSQLADKLHVTNKAVSKWERGLGAPDISLLRDLSCVLGVSVNELLIGEKKNYLTKQQTDDILVESVLSYRKKGIKDTIILSVLSFLMIGFFISSLVIFNFSMIRAGLFLNSVFLILAFFFISLLFFIKLTANNQIKRNIVLIFCVAYTVSITSYMFYTGIYFQQNIGVLPTFDVNFVPFQNIYNAFFLVLRKAQPISFLFQYIAMDLFLFMPYSFFVPFLLKKKFSFVKFLIFFLVLIIVKEMVQFLTGWGIFDVDDIILNFVGLIVMFYLMKWLNFFGN